MLWGRKHAEKSGPALYLPPSPLQMVLVAKVYILGFQICLYFALKSYRATQPLSPRGLLLCYSLQHRASYFVSASCFVSPLFNHDFKNMYYYSNFRERKQTFQRDHSLSAETEFLTRFVSITLPII